TITSLGGTPAYALACTNVVQLDLLGGCRNTDTNSPCPDEPPAAFVFRFHDALKQNPASGFTVDNASGNNTISGPGIGCGGGSPCALLPVFHCTDTTLQCQVFVQFWTKNCGASGAVIYEQHPSPATPSQDGATGITVQLPCSAIHNPGGTDQNA